MKTQGNLRYTIYECKYQIVFIHKYHQRVLFAALRQAFGNVFHELFRQKESPIVEGSLLTDHIHRSVIIHLSPIL